MSATSTGIKSSLRAAARSGYDALMYTSLYLALIAAGEVVIVMALLGYSLSLAPLVVGLLVFSVYVNDQLIDLRDGDVANPRERAFVERNEDVLYVFASVSYGMALSLSVWGGPVSFAIALVPGVAWIVYASDVVGTFASWLGLASDGAKDILLVNTTLVALAWSSTLVFVPLGFAGAPAGPGALVVFGYFFLRVFTNTEIANVPDAEEDRRQGVSTLPTVVGVAGTRWTLHAVDVATTGLLAFAVANGHLPGRLAVPLGVGLVYSAVVTSLVTDYADREGLARLAEYEYLVVFAALAVMLATGAAELGVGGADLAPTGLYAALMLAIGIGMSAGLLAWREYPEPGSLPLVVMLAGQCWWSATLFLEFRATTFATKLFLADVRWVGIVAIPVGWLLFALEYTGRNRYIQPRYVAALAVVPTLTAFLALTGRYNELLYRGSELVRSGSLLYLERTPGPWFAVITGYTYLLGVLGAIPLLELIRSNNLPFRGQSTALLVGIAAPALSNALFLFDALPTPGFDPTPLAFAVSGVAYLGALTRFQLLGSSPTPSRTAREVAFERMEQGVIVVDRNDFVIDVNDKAAEMLGIDGDDALGRPAVEVVPDYDRLPEQTVEPDRAVVHADDRDRSFEGAVSYVTDPYGRTTSKIITLTDVSEYLRQQQRLEVLVRAFRHNIRSKTQVVVGNVDHMVENDEVDRAPVVRENAIEIERMGQKVREIIELFERDRVRTVPLDCVIEDHVETIAAEYPGVTIREPEIPAGLRVSEVLDPVVRNVVENAVEHNDGDTPLVEIDVAVAPAGDRVRIVVADDGPGIGDHEKRVIERGCETKLKHGQGLGLWLIVWGAEIAGGEATFEDNDPVGTVVTIEVPLREPVDEASTPTETAVEDGATEENGAPAADRDAVDGTGPPSVPPAEDAVGGTD